MIKVSVATTESVKINPSESDAVNVNVRETEQVKINMGATCHITEADYEKLDNLPKINDVVVKGAKKGIDYGLLSASNIAKNSDIDKMFK